MKAKRDEALEEIWAIRRQIARRFGFDPKKQVAYYQQKQKLLGAKIYRPEVQTRADVDTPAVLHDQARPELPTGSSTTLTTYRVPKRKAKRAK